MDKLPFRLPDVGSGLLRVNRVAEFLLVKILLLGKGRTNKKYKKKTTEQMSKTWGKHLIIDAYGIDYKKLKDYKSIRGLLNSLPEIFKMRPLSGVVIKKVISENYPDWGVSGFIMLYESHISLHTWPEEGYVAMDLYSCKDFDHDAIKKYIKDFWGAKRMKVKLAIRG